MEAIANKNHDRAQVEIMMNLNPIVLIEMEEVGEHSTTISAGNSLLA